MWPAVEIELGTSSDLLRYISNCQIVDNQTVAPGATKFMDNMPEP